MSVRVGFMAPSRIAIPGEPASLGVGANHPVSIPIAASPPEVAAPRRAAFAGLGRFDAVVGAFCGALTLLVLALFPRVGLRVAWSSLRPLGGALGAFVLLLVFYGWRREARMTAVLRTTIWALALSNLCLLPLYLPMRHAIPLADPLLARLDHGMGFDDGALVAWTRARPAVLHLSGFVYDTLNVLCVLAVIATSFLGRVERAQNLLVAIIVGVFVTVVVAYFFPAIGPWETSAFAPTADQASCGRVIRVLQGGALYTVDMASPDAIIATPSWHVILAVLSAIALRTVRVIGLFSAAWAALIVVSTLTTGWHYLADVLAGVAVAFASQGIAARWGARLTADPQGR